MSYILNIETATKNCSVSLAKDGQVVAMREISDQGYSHAEKLHVFIDEVVREAKVDLVQLAAVAVSKGPGSYTGLRIGVSTAKGLCYSLNKPLIAIGTLEILARQVHIDKGLIVPMLDARRMEVYSIVLNSDYGLVRGVQAEILDEFSYNGYDQQIYFIGDGATKLETNFNRINYHFIQSNFPSANEMAMMSNRSYQRQEFEDLAYFEPYYLKDFKVQTKTKK